MKNEPKMPTWLVALCLVLIVMATVVGGTIFTLSANAKIEARKQFVADSLQRHADSLQKLVDTLTAPLTPSLLQYKLEIVGRDYEWGKDFASWFTAIAIKESGHRFCIGAVNRTKCPFGFHYRPNSPYCATFYDNGRGEVLSAYLSIEDALCDALLWVLYNPPKAGECFDAAYLRRRGYNNFETGYYERVERLRLK